MELIWGGSGIDFPIKYQLFFLSFLLCAGFFVLFGYFLQVLNDSWNHREESLKKERKPKIQKNKMGKNYTFSISIKLFLQYLQLICLLFVSIPFCCFYFLFHFLNFTNKIELENFPFELFVLLLLSCCSYLASDLRNNQIP